MPGVLANPVVARSGPVHTHVHAQLVSVLWGEPLSAA